MNMLMTFSNFDFVSEVFWDLWDMFWHHHWCLSNYLDPFTINFFEKKTLV